MSFRPRLTKALPPRIGSIAEQPDSAQKHTQTTLVLHHFFFMMYQKPPQKKRKVPEAVQSENCCRFLTSFLHRFDEHLFSRTKYLKVGTLCRLLLLVWTTGLGNLRTQATCLHSHANMAEVDSTGITGRRCHFELGRVLFRYSPIGRSRCRMYTAAVSPDVPENGVGVQQNINFACFNRKHIPGGYEYLCTAAVLPLPIMYCIRVWST